MQYARTLPENIEMSVNFLAVSMTICLQNISVESYIVGDAQ